MYLDYYHLRRKPFQVNTDPRFLWLGEKHKEALATLKYGIQDNKGFLLLTGDVGTGKTTLINALLNSLEERTVVASVPDPALSKLEFFQYVAASFGIKQPITDKVEFLFHFGEFLQEQANQQRKVLLIIDEAQRLGHELLEEIRLLSNIERQKTKLLNIFFIGQNELNDILADPRNRALRQRIAVNYHIGTLREYEVADYVKHRLLIAGSRKVLFNAGAIRQVHHFSKGYPRLINVICDRALLTGYVEEAKQINGRIIKECARELKLPVRSWVGTIWNSDGGDHGAAGGSVWSKKTGVKSRLALSGAFASLVAAAFIFLYSPAMLTHRDEAVTIPGEQGREEAQAVPEPARMEASAPPGEERIRPALVAAGGRDLSGIIEEVLEEEEFRSEPPAAASTTSSSAAGKLRGVDSAREDRPAGMFPDFLINFSASSNELSAASYLTLDRLAAIMREHADLRALVTGHTDSSGFHQLNLNISESRANMVKGYLVGRGIAPERIRTEGKGQASPVASNETSDGRRKNRRVEIKLTRER
jgi:general secretion pathway protein A